MKTTRQSISMKSFSVFFKNVAFKIKINSFNFYLNFSDFLFESIRQILRKSISKLTKRQLAYVSSHHHISVWTFRPCLYCPIPNHKAWLMSTLLILSRSVIRELAPFQFELWALREQMELPIEQQMIWWKKWKTLHCLLDCPWVLRWSFQQ